MKLFTRLAVPLLDFYLFSSISAAPSVEDRSLNHRDIAQIEKRAPCENTPTSRQCWGNYSIDTNYYDTIFHTGVTREFWFSIENSTNAPDGYIRSAMTVNGTIPGPSIIVDWGDDVVIHVTNNLQNNGTAMHWHGIRLLNTNEYDGVPGVTQCPIAPGNTMTYKWHASQYGSTWYHSHYSLQYGNGMYGPIIINGPATANYDIDLGTMHLADWAHESVFKIWDASRVGVPLALQSNLINGTNSFNCTGSTDVNCTGKGKKWETVFEPGKKYRLRLVDSAVEGHFQFSIDGHKLQVIANDLVPIVPYMTDSLLIAEGERYDVIIEANAVPGDYWLRGGWQLQCMNNDSPDNMSGIIRYNASSTANPNTTGITVGTNCLDEPVASLVPHLALNVGDYGSAILEDESVIFGQYATWTFNQSSFYTNWTDPTNLRIYDNLTTFPADYVAISLNASGKSNWTALIINDDSGQPVPHPIHVHGHDFWILSQADGSYNSSTKLNFKNPPRRDTASLPIGGHLAIAFPLDNPGSWLAHCHIAWHASQGFALQFVESESQIRATMTESEAFKDNCAAFDKYQKGEIYPQDDSGI